MAKDVIDLEAKRWTKLPPRLLARHLMTLSAKERMETIISRPDAEAVAAALSDQDFYLTVKEIGAEDALPLLAVASLDQITHVFDLEMWRKDRIVPGPAIQWLDRLFRADPKRMLAWLYAADFELLVSLFKKWIRVAQRPDEIDPLEAVDFLPKNTLDDQYYWETFYPQFEHLIRQVLSYLFETHYGFYKELMDHLLWALEPEMEEEAYRFHRGRLEDRAIPDYYDALEIYKPLDLRSIPFEKIPLSEPSQDEGPSSPGFALIPMAEGALLQRALAQVNDSRLVDTLRWEMAALANKIVVADGLAPDVPDDLHEAAEKAAAMVNLGLDLLSAGNESLALRAVQEVYMEHLFRAAQAKVFGVQKRLKALLRDGWIARWPLGQTILDTPWAERVAALLHKTPKLYRIQGAKRPRVVETFLQDRRDLHDARTWVAVVESVEPLFDVVQVTVEDLQGKLWLEGQVRVLEEVTLGVLLLTAAGTALLTERWTMKPIPLAQWPRLFSRATPQRLETLLQEIVHSKIQDSQQRRLAWIYVDGLLQKYREETESFAPHNAPDARLMSLFLFDPT
ncbi:DUF6178 family protein [Desulfosoma caldarium]|uniref:Uncharacterized protein n=1 Tax=Desulfosoma caldarium TaxID=610254 RepID=A0A3N1UEL4_9BACT|nr:DUF6178 family protein [Desulfosoma caldarium]ROQ89805.1 hypothetical protein EDC27_2917 [Desulfosoma caldarium]